jgi:hypothetical protein
LVTEAGVLNAVEPSKSCTCPFAPTEAVTEIANAMLVPLGTFVLVTDTFVVVATGVVPPLPVLLQPSAKLSTHTRPSPSAARYRFRPGKKSDSIAVSPAPALITHQPIPLLDGAKPAA